MVLTVMAALVMSAPSVWAAIYTGGPGASSAMGAMTNDVLLNVVMVKLSSSANQSFARGYAPVAISTITITDDPTTPVIKSGKSIAVRIPSDFTMTWDATNTTATFGGSAAGKVGAISYTGSNHRLIIAVTADFSAGQILTISALAFNNYLGSGSTHLELDYDNDGEVDAQDDKTITILGFYSYGGLGDSYVLDQMSIDKSLYLPIGTIMRMF